jgi:hypothetical protein
LVTRHRAKIETRVRDGFCGGRRTEGNYSGDVGAIFGFYPSGFVEPLHLAGNLYSVSGGIEQADPADAADATFRGFPEYLTTNSIRADGPDPGNHDAALLHLDPPPV